MNPASSARAGARDAPQVSYELLASGVRAGMPSIVVRFGAAREQPFDAARAAELLARVRAASARCTVVTFAGREPAPHVGPELFALLREAGYSLAIETGGAIALALPFDWISVRPRVAEHAIRQPRANEARYVRGHGQGIPKPAVVAEHYVLAAVRDATGAIDRAAYAWCRDLALQNPPWRLEIASE